MTKIGKHFAAELSSTTQIISDSVQVPRLYDGFLNTQPSHEFYTEGGTPEVFLETDKLLIDIDYLFI